MAAGTPPDAGHDETDALAVAICHAHRASRLLAVTSGGR
jgi:Holliday junction resolvasome RuvABC endonuclease subunit